MEATGAKHSTALQLWELAGDDERRVFSPYVWRVRLALYHKQIPYQSMCWRYADKEKIKPFEKVPVLDFEGQRLNESYQIIKWLDKQFPNSPQLRNGHPAGDAYADFINEWVVTTLRKPLLSAVLLDVFIHLAPQDRDYFRQSREASFGATLEQVGSKQAEHVQQLRAALEPARAVLADRPCLSGQEPGWADICVLSIFLWGRAVSPVKLLEPTDPLYEWRKRMVQHYNSAIQGTVGYPIE